MTRAQEPGRVKVNIIMSLSAGQEFSIIIPEELISFLKPISKRTVVI